MMGRELTLHQLLRCRHVKRFHIVNTARQQTVAEHSWSTAIITQHLCDALGLLLSTDDKLLMLEWALLHDTPETVIGDIPTPMTDVIGHLLSTTEHNTSMRWSMRQAWAFSTHHGLPAEIVKMADIIEAISFLHHDAVGEHAQRVRNALDIRLMKRIAAAQKQYPSYDWDRAVSKIMRDAITIGGDSHD